MKKYLLILICLIQVVFLHAANRYWVGGTGSWNSSSHWAESSSGTPGVSAPGINDDVFFDQNSFPDDNSSITISGTVQCNNFTFSDGTIANLTGTVNDKIEIAGSLNVIGALQNNFPGEISFVGSGNKIINFKYASPKGNVTFNGPASTWTFQSNLLLPLSSSVVLQSGNLIASNRFIQAASIDFSGSLNKSIDISNSHLILRNALQTTTAVNLSATQTGSTVYLRSYSGGTPGVLAIDSIHVIIVPPQCNTSCDGTVTVTTFPLAGGPYTYDWTGGGLPPGTTGNPLSSVCGGVYLLTVTDLSDGDQLQQFVTVIPPNPIGVTFVKKKPKCFGQCNGTITANTIGGTLPYSWLWSDGQTTQTAVGLCVGAYNVTVTDAHGCTQTFSTILTQPSAVNPNATFTSLNCSGVCTGTASTAASGGNTPTPYTYSWAPGGATTPSIAGLCAGSYTVTVKDDSLCVGTATVTITSPPPIVIIPVSTNISCFGACDGTAGVGPVSGGVPPYTYTWTPAVSVGPSASGLCPGAYSVVVKDANGCTANAAFNITQPATLTVVATGVNVTCFGVCNGSVTATVSGGTSPFTYTWTPGPGSVTTASVTNTLSSQCAGVYTINVTDSHGCTASANITITEPPVLLANAVGTNVLCNGACNGTITSTPTGGNPGYTYAWTGPAGFTATTATISGLCPGTYNVTVTDTKGCTSFQSVVITQPPVITTGLTFTNVSCNGACNGTATSSPSGGVGGYTFSWTGPAGFTATTAAISGLCPGVYNVVVTDANGCTKPGSVTITQPNVLAVSIVATALSCNGDCNATATATITGGIPPYTIDWLPGSPVGDGTTTISSLCAGTYTINVTDANGCPATATVTITQPTALNLTGATTNISCFGLCNGSAAAIGGGGTPAYSYSWAPGGQTTSSISAQCAGSYTVTLTDSKLCTKKDTLVIIEPAQLLGNPSVVTNISCAGVVPCDGSATSAATGGTGAYIYDWTPGSPAGDGTPTVTGLCAGTYNLIVTDANLCTSTMPVTITQPAVLSAPITGSTSSCNICNGTATVTPAGGTPPYSYLWAPGGQTTPTAIGLCPNVTYTVTVTDSHGCTATGTVTILQTIIINITTSNSTLSCFGACDGVATANASGGTIPYSYIWTGPMCGGPTGIVSLTQTAVGLGAGTYTVSVSDAAGCFNTDTVVFINPPLLTVTTTHTDLTCGGVCTGTGTANPLGGTGTDTYLWMPGGQTTQTATALCAGTYTVTVKDSSGCTAVDSVVITQPPVVIDNPTITTANCLFADGSISVSPTGGAGPGSYTYNWGPGAPAGDGTATITGLLPGAYTLTITSGACVYNFSYLLGNTTGPTLVMAHTDVSCHNACDGTATVTASGGAGGYIYDWTPGAPTGDGTNAITSLCGTSTYTVTVTDAAGCMNLDTARIINPLLISPNPTIVNESCGGSCNGSISLAPTGGTPGYIFSWSTGSSASSISGLCAAGSPYTVTVTDSKGCDSVLAISIVSPPTLTVSLTSTNVLCNGACNGTATATVVGGTPPYSYSWSHGGAFVLPTVISLCPGPYTVTVTDSKGCTATATVIITEPFALTTSTSQTNASCNAVCDGTATVTSAGGTIPYSYSWSSIPVQTTSTAISLCAGSYNVVVTDANGCTSNPPSVTITQPTPIVPNATGTNATCNGACNGTATANPTGGSGVYTYSWNSIPVQNTQTALNLCAGTYVVTVNDGSCTATQNVTLIDPPVLSANPTSSSPTCSGSCNGSVISNPVGGTPAYTYSWAPGGALTQSVAGLCAGVYTVIVTDFKNCKDTQSVSVLNPLPIDIVIGSTAATCGSCDGTFSISSVSGTPPFTYVWTIGGVSPPAPFAGQGTPNVTNVCAGLYSVLVTDVNGCDSTFVIPMNNSSGPTGETVSTTNATCNGACNGIGSIVPIGGLPPYSFLWNDGPPGTANDTAINLCAGNYFVQVTDASGCVHFSPVTITEPAPILSNGTVTSAICSNVCTGAITVAPTGGTGGYSYVWTPGVITGQGTPSVSGLCPGTYTLVITDGNSCTKVDSFVVGQSTPLTVAIASTNTTCSSVCNGMAYVTISSGTAPYIIQWHDPAGQTNDTATALCAGNYSVDITDANGCSVTLNTTITSAPALVPNLTVTNASCGLCDGTATLAPSGGTAGYTYLWSNGQTVANATNLCSGLYTCNITDAVGCLTSVPVPVSNSGGPTSATITSTNITCNGLCNGAVTAITPVGGTAPYTFLWIASGATTPTLGGLCAGTYFVQITDANGCSLMDSVVITEPAPILANQVIAAATCGACDGSITIAPSGGIGPYTVLWNTGSSSLALINLCAGVYSVQITDANGCVQNIFIPLNSQSGPSLSASSTNVSCNGSCNGSATVVAGGGVSPYVYLWNDVSAQTTSTATALCQGNYFVTVTDAAGCVSIASATITQPPVLGFSLANTVDPLCNGNSNGSITTIPSGGTLSYTYSWSPAPAAGQTTPTATGLNANTYVVTVTDANGCTATQTATLINPVSLTISDVATPPSCNTIPDGSIDVTMGGGTLPYSYQWSGSSVATTQDLAGILGGSYTITVTDSNMCTIADTIVLTPNATVIAAAGNDTSFCQSGSLTLSAAGSVNGVNYQWFQMPGNTSVGNTSSVSINPPAGATSYYVMVDNGTGCSDNDTIVVTSNALPTANAGPDVTIVIGASTTIGGSPTTTTAGATIQWMPSPGNLDNSTVPNPNATPSTTTTYTVTVTSPQGCTASDSATVTVRPTIIFPDGISPNGDGANDTWIIDGIELFPNCVVEVYNRWGELLFQSVGYKEHWDGTYKKEPLPVGTYYYVIDLKDPLFPDAYTGPITIMR